MKIAGKKIEANAVEVVVIPRQEGNIIIKAAPVTNFAEFDKLYPMPLPPTVLRPGGIKSENVEDPTYKAATATWAKAKTDWMIITSLKATEDLVWETVDYADMSTWGNYAAELETTFKPAEAAAIINAVVEACGLSNKKIEDATKSFLAGQAQANAAQ